MILFIQHSQKDSRVVREQISGLQGAKRWGEEYVKGIDSMRECLGLMELFCFPEDDGGYLNLLCKKFRELYNKSTLLYIDLKRNT